MPQGSNVSSGARCHYEQRPRLAPGLLASAPVRLDAECNLRPIPGPQAVFLSATAFEELDQVPDESFFALELPLGDLFGDLVLSLTHLMQAFGTAIAKHPPPWRRRIFPYVSNRYETLSLVFTKRSKRGEPFLVRGAVPPSGPPGWQSQGDDRSIIRSTNQSSRSPAFYPGGRGTAAPLDRVWLLHQRQRGPLFSLTLMALNFLASSVVSQRYSNKLNWLGETRSSETCGCCESS
jgi:hypothetical protein